MSFWTEQRPIVGMKKCDEKNMVCRYCTHAEKEHIGRCYCTEYPDGVYKPNKVMFNNAKCPRFERGEDLLPYEIEI